jgi:hypothetical protein
MLTDGLIPTKMIPILFVPEVLEELTTNDVSSPTLRVIDGGVMIHDFAEHQMTRAKIDEKRISGSKGGRAKAANSSSKNVAPATTLVEQNSTEPLASTEYRVQSTTTSKEVVSKARATRLPEPFEVTDAMREWAAEKHSNVDLVTATDNFVDYWRSKPTGATKLDWVATWRTWIRNTKPISQSRTFQTSADAKLDRNRQARANVEAMFTQQQAITENPDWA